MLHDLKGPNVKYNLHYKTASKNYVRNEVKRASITWRREISPKVSSDA